MSKTTKTTTKKATSKKQRVKKSSPPKRASKPATPKASGSPKPTATSTSTSGGMGRVSAQTKADRGELAKQIVDLPISKGHIAFGRNGQIYELYFKAYNGSPTIWKVKATTELDEQGYRSEGASALCTGVAAVRDAVKATTGKTPSAIGISLGQWQLADPRNSDSAKPGKAKRSGKLSLIDAAVQVLGASGEPMNCKQIVQQVMDKGLWKSEAATPHATLYSAILREMQTKGTDPRNPSRFTKVERGTFTLTKGA